MKHLLAFLLTVGFLWSQATVLAVQGTVRAKASSEAPLKSIQVGQTLSSGTDLLCAKDGLIHLQFPNGVKMLAKPGTKMTIKSAEAKSEVFVAQGEFLSGAINKLKTDEEFILSTSAVVLGIRGTLFWGLVEEDGTTTIAGLESMVSVQGEKGRERIVEAGKKIVVEPGDRVKRPKSHDIAKSFTETFAIGDSLQDLDSLIE